MPPREYLRENCTDKKCKLIHEHMFRLEYPQGTQNIQQAVQHKIRVHVSDKELAARERYKRETEAEKAAFLSLTRLQRDIYCIIDDWIDEGWEVSHEWRMKMIQVSKDISNLL